MSATSAVKTSGVVATTISRLLRRAEIDLVDADAVARNDLKTRQRVDEFRARTTLAVGGDASDIGSHRFQIAQASHFPETVDDEVLRQDIAHGFQHFRENKDFGFHLSHSSHFKVAQARAIRAQPSRMTSDARGDRNPEIG